jgi:modulator of FtsH protease
MSMLPPTSSQRIQSKSDFLSKVYGLLGLSLLFCAAGAYLGVTLPLSFYWPLVIGEFIVLIACQLLHRSYPLNIVLLGLFTWMSGMTLGPTLNYYIASGAGEAIPTAAGVTAVVFGGLSAYVHVSKKDFSFLGAYLFVALFLAWPQ